VPPTHLLVQQKGRATPYLYSESDIAALIAAAGTLRTPPSVPMIMRHLSPKSLASGRRTEITWLCQAETRSWMVPQGSARRKAGGLPLCRPLRRQLPNCRIGRAVGR
jgi:hypothetical protein